VEKTPNLFKLVRHALVLSFQLGLVIILDKNVFGREQNIRA
jgi:hypothetical protein